MSIGTLIILITCCLLYLIVVIWITCCIYNNIQHRIYINRISGTNTNTNTTNISTSNSYLFDNNRQVPPINHMPIVTGEKVDSERNGITVITVITIED
jgi:hypothetical protein